MDDPTEGSASQAVKGAGEGYAAEMTGQTWNDRVQAIFEEAFDHGHTHERRRGSRRYTEDTGFTLGTGATST